MSDHFPGEPGQDDAALAPEHARLNELLLAEGRRWRRNDLSTARLERHVQALVRSGVTLPRNEERMLSERNQALDTPAPRRTPQRPPSRWREPLALVATVLLVAMAASIFAFMSARSAGTGTGQHTAKATPTPGFTRVAAIQPKDTYLPLPANAYLSDLSFSSAHDGWAVGGIITPNQPGAPVSTGRGALIHYHDGVWTAASDSFLGMSVDSVSMVSADDGWAVGHANDTQADYYSGTVLLHYTGDGTGSATGGAWKMVAAPALVNLYPRTIHMFSPDSGYITGVISVPSTAASNSESQRVAVAVYQQGVWKLITTPFADIDKVVMASAAEGWAVDYATSGGSSEGPTTLYHYLNGVWTKALSLPIFFGSMGSISLGSAVDVWVIGFSWCMACAPDTYYKPVIYHFNGSAWSHANPPSMPNIPQSLLVRQSIFDGMASGVWLTLGTIGAVSHPGQRPQHTAMMWVNRGDGWMRATQPVTGASVFALTTDGNGGVWAIAQQSTTPFGPSVLYTQGNEWKVYGRSG